MTAGIKTIVYPVKDLALAKALYSTLLGVEPYVDEPYYAGFRVGDQEIGLDPGGHDKNGPGPLCYLHVDDIRAALEGPLGAGSKLHQDVTDVGYGRQIAVVRDADGNLIGLLQEPAAT